MFLVWHPEAKTVYNSTGFVGGSHTFFFFSSQRENQGFKEENFVAYSTSLMIYGAGLYM